MHSVTYYGSYGVVLAVVLAGALLVIVAFGAARLIAPRRPNIGGKRTTYECGIDPVGEGWSQSQVRYYVYGFLFVIFCSIEMTGESPVILSTSGRSISPINWRA